jgi:hypothetical protein
MVASTLAYFLHGRLVGAAAYPRAGHGGLPRQVSPATRFELDQAYCTEQNEGMASHKVCR